MLYKSTKNIFKHSGVAGEFQLGAECFSKQFLRCEGTLTHSEFKPRYANSLMRYFSKNNCKNRRVLGNPTLDSRFFILSYNWKLF